MLRKAEFAYKGRSKDVKYSEILKNMTLEEKCALLTGKNTWESRDYPHHGIPSVWMSDGPHGLRKQLGSADHLGINDSQKATCFPTAATMANSWDEVLAQQVGVALGDEAAAQRIHVLLGPGLCIKRSPLCGRNFEYFSEDPYLAGKMAAAYVRGIQMKGGSACPKHFAVNSQEERRMASNSVVDERTLREIYLTGFEIAVKEGRPHTIMTSYNEVNGTYANENRHLLQDILRNEWGFDGAVVTDWGGNNDNLDGIRNGSNLEMPSGGMSSVRAMLKGVKEGKLSEADIDARCDELLGMIFHAAEQTQAHPVTPEFDALHVRACDAAAQSAVMLKNDNGILPLKRGTRVAIVGDFGITPRFQGAGSSVVNAYRTDDVREALEKVGLEIVGSAPAFKRHGGADDALLQDAVALAKQAQTVLFYMGLDEISESEGHDRRHMKLHDNQLAALQAVAQVNANVVVILSAGSPIEMPWIDDAMAILHGYLNGQAGCTAMAQLLVGAVNPSGKLSETIPMVYEDAPMAENYPCPTRNILYKEGLYVGYRYYDTAKVPVRFPFGFGMSYTQFAYSNLQASEHCVSFTITNTGSVDGSEIAQLYVSKPDAQVFRPEKELKGFAKVFLRAGESKTVTIALDDKALRYFNVKTNRWEIEGGAYVLSVGASAAQLLLQATITVAGTDAPNPYDTELPSYRSGQVKNVSDTEYEMLLGHEIPEETAGVHRNTAIRDLNRCKSPLGRLICRVLAGKVRKSEETGVPDLNTDFIYNVPLRGMAKFAGAFIDMGVIDGLVMEFRGFWIIGLIRAVFAAVYSVLANKCMEAKLKKQAKEKKA